MPKMTEALKTRIKMLERMAEKYRQAGNELAASRCEQQIRTIEHNASRDA
jgi:hypothetical protein